MASALKRCIRYLGLALGKLCWATITAALTVAMLYGSHLGEEAWLRVQASQLCERNAMDHAEFIRGKGWVCIDEEGREWQ